MWYGGGRGGGRGGYRRVAQKWPLPSTPIKKADHMINQIVLKCNFLSNVICFKLCYIIFIVECNLIEM
jgi:hypothetical protein